MCRELEREEAMQKLGDSTSYSFTTIDQPNATNTTPASINTSGEITGYYGSFVAADYGYVYNAFVYEHFYMKTGPLPR